MYPTYKLFIDDERYPVDGLCTIVRSSKDAIERMIAFGCPSFISFDHDLGGDDTSMKIVHWMIEKDLDRPGWIPDDFSFYVHSQNPIGKKNIEGLLGGYLKQRLERM